MKKTRFRMMKALCAIFASLSAFAVTAETDMKYYLIKTEYSNVDKAEDWQRLDGDTRAPTNPQNTADQCEFVVKDGFDARDTSFNNWSRDIYGKSMTFGEIGGTKGNFGFTASFMESSHVYFHATAYFANGQMRIRGNWNNPKTRTGALLQGSVVVTSPMTAPFDMLAESGVADDPWLVHFENSFASAADCGFKSSTDHNKPIYHIWKFFGDLSGYKGTMDFSGTPTITISFEDTIGTTDFKELKFNGASTNFDNCIMAPLMAQTLSFGDGTTFKLAATTSENVVKTASLKCETAAFAGKVNLSLAAFPDPVLSEDVELDVVLFEATNGGLTDEMFNVDLGANVRKPTFKGCAVNAEGTKLVARFEIPADRKYYLNKTEYSNVDKAEDWQRLDGDTRAPTNPQNAADQCEFVVKDGLDARDTTFNSWTRDIYGKSMTFGEVGGTKGNFGFTASYMKSSYVCFHATAYFANGQMKIRGNWNNPRTRTGALLQGTVEVTAPSTAPFEFLAESGAAEDPWLVHFENSFASAADCGIKSTTDHDKPIYHIWKFLGDLSDYKGTMDFSGTPTISLVFGADVGALDMRALNFAADQNVTLVGRTNATAYQMPCLDAQTVTLGGDLNITLDLAERIPSAVSRIAVLRTSAAINTSEIKVQAQGVGAKRFKGVVTEVANGVTTVYAQVPPPGLCLVVR